MEPFSYTAVPARVVFGLDFVRGVGDEVRRLGLRRVFVLSGTGHGAGLGARLARALGPVVVGVSGAAAMHTPVQVTEAVMREVEAAGADGLVALGGGSAIGLSKALALRTRLPQVVVPTTYAGSEATPVLGQTENGRKTTLRSADVLPASIVYDVDLTLDLAPALSAASGLNAIAHAVEALYARDANPITTMLAEDAIERFGRALPAIADRPRDRHARGEALYAAWACGGCLAAVGMALHHKLCHVLGGTFDLPHAETHAVILPHVAAFNRAEAGEALGRAARALKAGDAAEGLFDLGRSIGAPVSLRQLGMAEGALDGAADSAVSAPYWNPRPVDRAAIRQLLDDAYHGRRPQPFGS